MDLVIVLKLHTPWLADIYQHRIFHNWLSQMTNKCFIYRRDKYYIHGLWSVMFCYDLTTDLF